MICSCQSFTFYCVCVSLILLFGFDLDLRPYGSKLAVPLRTQLWAYSITCVFVDISNKSIRIKHNYVSLTICTRKLFV